MKWTIALIGALTLGAAACGSGGKRAVSMPDTNTAAVITATPTIDAVELASRFQQLIASQRAVHQAIENDRLGVGEASIETKVSFEKNTGLILDLCSVTWEINDRDWKAVFDATCSELGPIMLRFKPERYDNALRILINAINKES